MGVSVEKPVICLLTYYRKLGNLKDYIERSTESNFNKDIKILYEIASAMNYCHSQEIPVYHMDFSDKKVLFVLEDSVEVKGFGIRLIPINNRGSLGYVTIINSPEWVPPEVIKEAKYYESYEYDVYSFGILMCKLLSRKQPYNDMNPMRLVLNIINNNCTLNMPTGIPENLMGLIRSCTDKDPKNRPKFDIVVETLKKFIHNERNDSHFISDGTSMRTVTWSPVTNEPSINFTRLNTIS